MNGIWNKLKCSLIHLLLLGLRAVHCPRDKMMTDRFLLGAALMRDRWPLWSWFFFTIVIDPPNCSSPPRTCQHQHCRSTMKTSSWVKVSIQTSHFPFDKKSLSYDILTRLLKTSSFQWCFFRSITPFPHCLKITQNVAFEFWHFPPNFDLLKLTCLVTLFDRKLQVFKNSPHWTIFGIF